MSPTLKNTLGIEAVSAEDIRTEACSSNVQANTAHETLNPWRLNKSWNHDAHPTRNLKYFEILLVKIKCFAHLDKDFHEIDTWTISWQTFDVFCSLL